MLADPLIVCLWKLSIVPVNMVPSEIFRNLIHDKYSWSFEFRKIWVFFYQRPKLSYFHFWEVSHMEKKFHEYFLILCSVGRVLGRDGIGIHIIKGLISPEMPDSIKIKLWYKWMVGSKYFQIAVLFSVYGLIAKSVFVSEHLEQISLYTRQNAITCTCM